MLQLNISDLKVSLKCHAAHTDSLSILFCICHSIWSRCCGCLVVASALSITGFFLSWQWIEMSKYCDFNLRLDYDVRGSSLTDHRLWRISPNHRESFHSKKKSVNQFSPRRRPIKPFLSSPLRVWRYSSPLRLFALTSWCQRRFFPRFRDWHINVTNRDCNRIRFLGGREKNKGLFGDDFDHWTDLFFRAVAFNNDQTRGGQRSLRVTAVAIQCYPFYAASFWLINWNYKKYS